MTLYSNQTQGQQKWKKSEGKRLDHRRIKNKKKKKTLMLSKSTNKEKSNSKSGMTISDITKDQ